MKVKAKHWINYNGVWHKGGEEFEIEDSELLDGVVAVQEEQRAEMPAEPETESEFQSEIFPPEEEAPKKRGRPRKNPD